MRVDMSLLVFTSRLKTRAWLGDKHISDSSAGFHWWSESLAHHARLS